MSTTTSRLRVLTISSVFALTSCGSATLEQSPPIVQPGAPGESSRIIDRDTAVRLEHPTSTAADVRFMQGMIGHHRQAIDMTNLLESRTNSEAMQKLAERIEVSQSDEIRMMQDWLQARGAAVPAEHAHHDPAMRMPGMLTPEEMSRLAAAKGTAFDKLFLEYMIRHHEGALVMVRELFATPGAGQESEIYAFASDVVADQRMEIARMAGMLKELEK
jgi:uncharacterized protein (DUF305 family)